MKKSYISILCGLILLGGFLSSCGKESKVAIYHFYCDTAEFTQPGEIQDPAMREAYSRFLTDFMSDLVKLNLVDTHQVDIVNGKFSAEDEKQLAEYKSHLPALKEIESSYRKKAAALAAPFHIKVVYTLSRSVPADASPAVSLQEYSFELKN